MGEPGLALIERFLHRTIAHRSQLVLPTHGVPPSQSEEISRLRAEVREIMTRILKRGNKDGTVRADFFHLHVINRLFYGLILRVIFSPTVSCGCHI
jgi:hypothetical protein